ncbi:hypothetical protein PPYR_01591 [Photinus pyralis]|uniref:Reverse transcriptase domain-containing protein n=1 Tax=Photinus pyralis TaxID=7054 RepID=A0A5N4B4S9_PHOPY|nr:hypothetical protein PPYR_01591 [Photinus pyralis]
MDRQKRLPLSLHILAWNANGLRYKRDELQELLFREAVDVALISETHLNAGITTRIPGYTIHRSDRQTGQGGGTAIFVKNDLEHHEIQSPPLLHVETNAVIVNTRSAGALKLVSVYKAPQEPFDEQELDLIFDIATPTIVAGDLNAKHPSWNSRTTNPYGRRLYDFASRRAILVEGPVEPTHFPPGDHRPDVLDIALFKNVALHHHISTAAELSSDHNPITIRLGGAVPPAQHLLRLTNWRAYRDTIATALPPVPIINTTDQLDEAVALITTTINRAIAASTTTRAKDDWDPLALTDIIKELIRDKNRARREYQRSRDPADKAELNRLEREVKTSIWNHRNEQWRQKVESLNPDDGSLWTMSRYLRKKRPRLPPLHGPFGVAYTDADKAEALADSLEAQCSPVYEHLDEAHIQRVHSHVRRQLAVPPPDRIPHTTAGEVRNFLTHLKIRKAPGPDGIPNRALILLPKKGVAHLVAIYNATLRLRHFPTAWKCADVIQVLKPGKPENIPASYRPISLLCALGKTLERIVLARLEREVEALNLLPSHQFGFRARHSTTQQALRVVEHITEGFTRKEHTGGLFLDISKAFDSVWHRGLLYKLLRGGVSLPMVHLLASFLQPLQVVQNRFLRLAVNAPWFVRNEQLHREFNIATVREYMRDAAARFMRTTQDHPNPDIQDAWAYDVAGIRRHKRPKCSL